MHLRVLAIGLMVAGCTFEPSVQVGGEALDASLADGSLGPDSALLACVASPAGLIAWWPGDDMSEIVSAHHGTGGDGVSAGNAGQVGGAFQFDGIQGRLDLLGSQPAAETQFTIETWIYFDDSNGSWRSVFSNWDTRGFWMLDRRIDWWQGSDRFRGDTTIPIGEWHHVALSFDGTTLRGYVDGVADGESFFEFARLPLGASIGGNSQGDSLKGKLDDVSIYDRALSASELLAIASAGSAGKCLP